MSRLFRVCAASVLLAALVAGCGAASPAPATAPISSSGGPTASAAAGPLVREVGASHPRLAPAAALDAGAAMAGFGSLMLKALPAEGNLVISPYSIYVALAMARQGASGTVASELDTVLRSPEAAAVVTAVDAALLAAQPAATAPHDNSAPVIAPANSLWVQDAAIEQPFLDRVSAGFAAGVHLTDFADHPEDAWVAINGWVSEHTKALTPNYFQGTR